MRPIFGSIIPAPNASGELHMGHVLNLCIQDVFCRWNALKGAKVYWIGSLDHGTTATEFVVDRKVRESGKDISHWTRQNWIDELNEWIAYITPRMYKQLRRMNLMMDIDEVRSMDDPFQRRQCQELLQQLEKAKLLYRTRAVIPWCPVRRTFVDKAEISHEPRQVKEYLVRYVDENDPNREVDLWVENPEILLNDGALIVSSQHPMAVSRTRFVITPLGLKVPVVQDDGFFNENRPDAAAALRPGHCARSFRWARRNRFPITRVYDENNLMESGKYKGQTRENAAKEILAEAEAAGKLKDTRTSEREREIFRLSNGPVEEFLTEQCFLETEKMAAGALRLLRSGEVRLHPKIYQTALELRLETIVSAQANETNEESADDWCVSQQTIWGNELPISHLPYRAEMGAEESTTGEKIDHIATLKLADALFACYVNRVYPLSKEELRQIADASICVTGLDLLLFWIEPILMLSTVLEGGVPFRDVIIHPLICDSKGRKMSKSLGNVVVPDEMWDKYGSDALRLALFRSVDFNKQKMRVDEDLVRESKQLLSHVEKNLQGLQQRIATLGGSFAQSQNIHEQQIFADIDHAMTKFDLKGAMEHVDLIMQMIVSEGGSSDIQQAKRLLGLASLLEPFCPELICESGLHQRPFVPIEV